MSPEIYKKNGKDFNKFKNDYEARNKLKDVLLIEQGHICCYCGQAIKLEKCVLEHIKPKEHYPELALDYTNLVCSCCGGQTNRQKNKNYPVYCDAKKGKEEIDILPTDKDCENRFMFDDQGNIFAAREGDTEAENTIDILGLNTPTLVNKRRAAIDAYRYLDSRNLDWEQEIEKLIKRDIKGYF
ncbi:retron system putative HNH endonuclease [Clostridium sardiniense]|uniref:retron system putative HNH endonuclease n=1 Tax=Clostridium sardiniense TaxID=29369 RepID=UPI00195EAE1D|nr:uncharacterized protein (TIGR02646 family) [Clostridium sardiniense]